MTESYANPAGTSRVCWDRAAHSSCGLGSEPQRVFRYLVCSMHTGISTVPKSADALAIFLPGFTLLSWQSYILGLVESFIWGWYIALLFGALLQFLRQKAPMIAGVRITPWKPACLLGLSIFRGCRHCLAND